MTLEILIRDQRPTLMAIKLSPWSGENDQDRFQENSETGGHSEYQIFRPARKSEIEWDHSLRYEGDGLWY